MTLEILTSDSLSDTRHGFFTRRGGASSGVYAGLNCGHGSTDQSEIVTINRNRVADAMGVSAEHLAGVNQVHSADVITITEPSRDKPKADALVTKTPGIALSVLTADCQPVLFADSKAGVIGAAACPTGGKRPMGSTPIVDIDMENEPAERRPILTLSR